jgi:hypothetical protein
VTGARLARWAARFRAGHLVGAPGELRWDGAAPTEADLTPWAAAAGPCRAELWPRGDVVVKLLPGVRLRLDGGGALHLHVPFGEGERRLVGVATATGGWSLEAGPLPLGGFERVGLHPDGRVELASTTSARRAALAARLLTTALQRHPRWAAVAPWLAG